MIYGDTEIDCEEHGHVPLINTRWPQRMLCWVEGTAKHLHAEDPPISAERMEELRRLRDASWDARQRAEAKPKLRHMAEESARAYAQALYETFGVDGVPCQAINEWLDGEGPDPREHSVEVAAYTWDDCEGDAVESVLEFFEAEGWDDSGVNVYVIHGEQRSRIAALTDSFNAQE